MLETTSKDTITSKQAATLIVASQIGVSIQVIPSAVAEKAGHDGWMAILIVGIFEIVSVCIIIALSKRFQYQSILDISKTVCGKYAAFILNLVLLLSLVFILIGNYSLFVEGVGIWFFRKTPNWALAIYLILPSVYLVSKGLKCICRFTFLLYLVLPLILGLIIINLRDFHITALLPVCENGMSGIMKAIPYAIIMYTGLECTLFVAPNIENAQKLSRKFIPAVVISTLIFASLVIVTMGVFGENLVVTRFNALLSLARLIKLPVIERIDLYFIAVWVFGMSLVVNSYLFLICDTAKRVFKYKAQLIPIAIVSTIVVIVVGQIQDDILILKLMNMAGFASCFVGFIIPLILLVVAIWRNKRGV